jgi:conjugal transfer pilin signal peptidase TrbI
MTGNPYCVGQVEWQGMLAAKWGVFRALFVAWLKRRWLWIAVPSGAVVLAGQFVSFGANITPSLPQHVFLVLKYDKQVRPGDYAVFIPPRSVFHKNDDALVKIVAGVPGDVISFDGQELLLNGVSMGQLKPRSTRGPLAGVTLSRIAQGVIPPGHFFMHAPHPDSLDSRYTAVGLIAQERIVGRALPLF